MEVAQRKKRVHAQHVAKASDAEMRNGSNPSLADVMPESDPAFPIVSTILHIVPASRWTFAHVGPEGLSPSFRPRITVGRNLLEAFGRTPAA